MDEQQYRPALRVYRDVYVVFILRRVDGQHGGQSLGAVLHVSFGTDKTQVWSLAGLSSTQVVGILAVFWMVMVTLVASKGINKIARITAVGGISVMCLNPCCCW